MTRSAKVGQIAPLASAVLIGGCLASRALVVAPDNAGCFQGAYPSAPTELHRAILPDPTLVMTQQAGLHVAVRDSRQPYGPVRHALVLAGDDDDLSRQRSIRSDGRLTVKPLLPGKLRVLVLAFPFESSMDSVRLRAGFTDTLVLRRGYGGNECYIVPVPGKRSHE